MDPNSLKTEMKRLWKETFHDSDDYVDLIFDTYFDPELVAWHEADGRLVSALLGIPYTFRQGSRSLRALYLCGLATDPAFRRHGIMDSLLNDINAKGAEMGFAFSFLIPADEGLHRFYLNRGYSFATFRVPDRYVSSHDFERSYLNMLNAEQRMTGELKKRYFNTLSVEPLGLTIDELNEVKIFDKNSDKKESESVFEKIEKLEAEIDSQNSSENNSENGSENGLGCCLINRPAKRQKSEKKCSLDLTKNDELISALYGVMRMCESGNDYLVLAHSPMDFLTAVKENLISGGEVVWCRSRCDRVPTGLAFVTLSDGEVSVPYILSTDRCSLFRMLDFVKKQYPDKSMTVYRFPEQVNRKGIVASFYSGAMRDAPSVGTVNVVDRVTDIAANAPVYGMARILSVSEILKFLKLDPKDPKYSILVNGQKWASEGFESENQNKTAVGESSGKSSRKSSRKTTMSLTMEQLQQILFRRKDTDPLMGDLLGLPRLALNMALLLD